MRLAWMLAWLAGLALASVASWWVWRNAPIPDEMQRFAATLAPVLVWSLLPPVFGRWLFAGKARTETPGLREQKRMAMRFLADRGLKGNRGRHSLPLFLVAGPAGAGKSSLIEQTQAGLGMPVAIGAARWWVGQDAIFVETNFDSEQSAQDVVDLIRAMRPRQPVNATLLAISPPDLALADEVELKMVSEAIASELRLIEERIGVGPPVYLLLTKTDMMPGFREFFDRLEPQDREAPWGFALPFLQPPAAEQAAFEFERGMERLVSGMRARHIEWLSREADAVRSARIHGFSTQGAAIGRQIRPILEALAPKQTHLWKGAVLRGVFLTSARQEPLTIDVLLPELSRRFSLPRIGTLPPDLGMEDENHGYFVAGAFRSAILPEAGLIAAKRSPWPTIQWTLIALMIGGALAASWALYRVVDQQTRMAARLSEAASEFPAVQSPSTVERLGAVLSGLQRFDTMISDVGATPPVPPYAFWIAGRDRNLAAAQEARRAYLRNALLPHLSALLETQLADVERPDEELLSLIAVAEAGDDPESGIVREWLERNADLVAEDDREKLVREGLDSIRAGGGLTIDPGYVDAARRMLAYRDSLT